MGEPAPSYRGLVAARLTVRLDAVVDDPIRIVPDRMALIEGDRRITYRALGEAVASAAANLGAAGVAPGDRVAVAEGCGLLAVATVLGAARIGVATAPIDPALTATEMATLVSSAGLGPVGVAGDVARERLAAAIGREPLDELHVLAPGSSRAPAAVVDDDVAAILFTGGTTGTPKPIPLTHVTLATRVRSFAPPPDPNAAPATALLCVPFHHVAGLVGALVGLAGGNTTVVQRRFDAGEWLRLVSRHEVSRSFLVPTMLRRILDHPAFGEADLRSLAMITYGAAPAASDLVARAVEALPHVAFINVFGQTETLGAVTALGPEEHRAGRAGSIGRPLPGVEIRIVDPESEADVAAGDVGEMWVRAAHTARPGWVRTGDLVREDGEGFLYAAGRLSDSINRGGEKISPAEVEAALLAHPLVAEAAVSGIPDAEMGERVGAAIVSRGPVTDAELKAWCRDRLAGYKVPERVVFVDALPLTELGKVSRPALSDLLGG